MRSGRSPWNREARVTLANGSQIVVVDLRRFKRRELRERRFLFDKNVFNSGCGCCCKNGSIVDVPFAEFGPLRIRAWIKRDDWLRNRRKILDVQHAKASRIFFE